MSIRFRLFIMSSLLAGFLETTSFSATQNASIDLAGEWRFALDRKDEGVAANWAGVELTQKLRLPGMLSAQGQGDPVTLRTPWVGDLPKIWTHGDKYKAYQSDDNFKMPFWLQPPLYYAGAAWYQRDFVLPQDWQGRRVVLHLERPHWETRIWIDGKEAGHCERLGTPHDYDLGSALAPGKHSLSIRIDNRMIVEVGVNSHSVSDNTQGNWNGIVGSIELRQTPLTWIDELRSTTFPKEGRLSVEVIAKGGDSGKLVASLVSLDGNANAALGLPSASPMIQAFQASGTLTKGRGELVFNLGDRAQVWNEFTPHRYRLTVQLESADGVDSRTEIIGFRELRTQGTRFILNGQPIYLRGTLECCIFPREGHPPTDVESWLRLMRIAKAHGLNHLRFHSWCPPEAAFEAADELGLYLQIEASSWANQGAEIGSGRPLDAWIEDEAAAIVRTYGEHPSFMFFTYGNEPHGPNHAKWLADFVARWKARDPRRLYTTGSGWPIMPGSDYHSHSDPRLQQWGAGLNSRINAQEPSTDFDWSDWVGKHTDAPTVSHEIGQWCAYPNFHEIEKYTGFFKAKNFEIFREQARTNGVLDQADDFLRVSGKLQTLCYKADIEAALRTSGFGGFQLLGLYDFSGQGTALVGVLDAFWDSKGYVSAEEYRRFCGPVVPLLRLPKMVYVEGERIEAVAELSQFGASDLKGPVLWELRQGETLLASGKLAEGETLARGGLRPLGKLDIPLSVTGRAAKLSLSLSLPQTPAKNSWDLWVYPVEHRLALPAGVRISSKLDADTQAFLKDGGSVLLLPKDASIKGDPNTGPVELGYSSIFWNTIWTLNQAPHTLGILCDPAHPALALFPTDEHTNVEWWDLLHKRHPFILTAFRSMKPIVQVVDDWNSARKLGLVFEARVGRGRLLVCAIDLETDLAKRPAARQFKESLLHYLAQAPSGTLPQLSISDLGTLMMD
jgi:hypothetical protein